MNERDWVESEAGVEQMRLHAVRLFRRARARWKTTVLVTLVLAAAVVAVRLHQRRTFHAEVVLRVSEDEVDATTEPRTNELKAALSDVAFSGPNLLKIIRARHLYPTKYRVDPQAAVEAMRDDIEVEMARNYFLAERGPDDPPRTALITIDFRSGDPEEALDVVQDLAKLAIDQEKGSRKAMVMIAAEEAGRAATQLADERVAAQQRMSALERRIAMAPREDRGWLLVELQGLHKNLQAMDARRRDAETTAGALGLRASLEEHAMGVHFDVVDTTPPKVPLLSRRYELALLGAVGFLVFLPLAALGVGAADRKVRDTDDLRALGLEPLGHLPPLA